MDTSISDKTLEENLHTVRIFRTLSDPIEITEYARKRLRLTFPFTTPKYIETSLYRVRPHKKIKNEDFAKVSTFSYVPRELNKKGIPSMGRFNQNGQSIFYASLYGTTNLKEMKDEIEEGDIVYLSKWKIKENAPIRLYYIYPPSDTNVNPFQDSNIHPLIRESLKEIGKILLENETKENKYLKTSLIGNAIFNFNTFGVNYDAILYPSVLGNDYEYNLAIKPEFVDANMELQCVYRAVVKDNLISVDCSYIGLNCNNEIQWHKLSIEDMKISFSFIDKENKPIMVYGDSHVIYNNAKYSIAKFDSYLQENMLIPKDVLYKKGFFHEGQININDYSKLIGVKRSKCYDINVHGMKLCSYTCYDVAYLRIEVNYKNTLEPINPCVENEWPQ